MSTPTHDDKPEPPGHLEPYCSQCGYRLTGLVDSSKCPECGRPIVEVLQRGPHHWQTQGRRYESKTRVFGLPLVHVAVGPHGDELRGRARGIIAIGDIATGVFAFGGIARGLFAFGGLAIGLVAWGGLGLGLLIGMGGLGTGVMAAGGGALGGATQGGLAVGIVADGGLAVGIWARGGKTIGRYRVTGRGSSIQATTEWAKWHGLMGARPGSLWMMFWTLLASIALALVAGLVILIAINLHVGTAPPTDDIR